jgi:hypothetical protein
MARERLGDILIKAGLLDEAGLQRALNEQQRWGGQLGRYLVEMGLITEETLVRALSTQYKVPAVALDPQRMDISVGRLIPQEICERNNLICFRADRGQKFLDVAMGDPSNLDASDEVRVATQFNVRPYIAAPSAIDRAIAYVFYGDIDQTAMDLSPESNLRLDASSSELAKKLRKQPSERLSKGSAPGTALDPVRASVLTPKPSPAVDVKVSVGQQPPAGGPQQSMEPISLPEPVKEDGFHISMEVPAMDKAVINKQGVEQSIARLEATVTRNSAILKALMEALAHKGLMSKKEIRQIITPKKS